MDKKTKIERANAFVDGELDRAARTDVLAEAARNPDMARELAQLNRLKMAVEDSVEVPAIDLPASGRGRAARRWAIGLATAASLALVAVTGIIAWTDRTPATDHGIPLAWALDVHGGWRDAGPAAGNPGLPRPTTVRLDAHVPDLSAAKLRIAHVGAAPGPDGAKALVVGYLGTRGCRVTLLVDGGRSRLTEDPVFVEAGGVKAMAWRAGRLRHLILAEGMEQGRFRMIAKAVHRASLERLPVDEPTRMALARSRRTSPPCAA
ncbi:MAG: hypothetical protein R3229_02785 [Alphaproteobacteria bacterium]|nr:hypothetical protein [Alphaproteobacteria bacterium]